MRSPCEPTRVFSRPVCAFCALCITWTASTAPDDHFAIHVVDDQTGRGVPLVELATTNNIRHYTDSAGYVAFLEPGLMGREVWFGVKGHGYEYPADGFGIRGVRLTPTPGGSAEIRIKRLNIAERLYRITGGGIYRDSVLLGRPVPIREPVLSGLVLGQDSVQTIVYRGRLHWFWGDTSWPAYPLGNFQVSGATSKLPAEGGLRPEVGVDLTYFVRENGFSKEMAPVPGDGPCWVDGLVTLPDETGRERLYATYAKVRPDMSAWQRGFLLYDDEAEQFRKLTEFDVDPPILPGGHALRHGEGGVDYIYFARPFPTIRVRADVASYLDLGRYESYTCLKAGSTAEQPVVERDADGAVVWAWKRGVPPLLPAKQEKLIKTGELKPHETGLRLHDVVSGKPVQAHGSSVAWNAYRQRWIGVFLEAFGSSLLGEIWYAEAERPEGPWGWAVKVVTHDKYSFYNPRHHPYFDEDGGRRIYFEGTYTLMFSGNTDPTPRYEYNQIMYRLDLDDPRLKLPDPDQRPATRASTQPIE